MQCCVCTMLCVYLGVCKVFYVCSVVCALFCMCTVLTNVHVGFFEA